MRSVNDSPGVYMRVRLPAGPLPRHARRFCTSRPTLEQPGVRCGEGHRQKHPRGDQLGRLLRTQTSAGQARHMHTVVHCDHAHIITSDRSDLGAGMSAPECSETNPPTARCQLCQIHSIAQPVRPPSLLSSHEVHMVLWVHLEAAGAVISST